MRKLVPMTDDEHAYLIETAPFGTRVHTTIPNGDLVVDTDNPSTLPPLRRLMAKRGISNQNVGGAGI